jgi:hypothetical protein
MTNSTENFDEIEKTLSLPSLKLKGSVVQLVRMPPCHGGGRGFESRPVRKVPPQGGIVVSGRLIISKLEKGAKSQISLMSTFLTEPYTLQ